MPRAKYNYDDIHKIITWGEGTFEDSNLEMYCISPRHVAIWLQIYIDV